MVEEKQVSTRDVSRRGALALGRLALYTAPVMVALLTSAQAQVASQSSPPPDDRPAPPTR
jgi:hypothetical protein